MAIDIDRLSDAEKILLAEDLWDAVRGSADQAELYAAERAALDVELDDLERNPDACVPWAEVKQRISARRHG